MPRKTDPENPDGPERVETLKGYPVGPPRTPQRMPSWVWVFLTFFVCAMAVVMVGISYVYVPPYYSTGDITYINFEGELTVDNEEGLFKFTLMHRGGDSLDLTDHRVTVNGVLLDGTPVFINGLGDIHDDQGPEMSVGERAYWVQDTGDTTFTAGEEYTVKFIEMDSDSIVWEGDVLATEEDI